MAEKPTDKVVSYVVAHNGIVSASYEPLEQALKEGYRVVDVFTTPVTPGGGSNVHGHCVVTVLLNATGKDITYRNLSPRKEAGVA
jgi:hypothetical protein